ncbi:hypothetical protein NRA32_18110 [Acinetobacter baumannii]|nr:hypothetical protein [Acinetobacter baumannii]MDC5417511.1 hypothetical protein [Acinetobacter baumannii]
MKLKKLDASFYTDNPVVIQALEFDINTNTWMNSSKIRGHGVVQIKINSLIFAIPARSNITHDASYILLRNTDKSKPHIKGMGLDYSKALLIRNPSHVSDNIFVLNSKQAGKKLLGKEFYITSAFEKYVLKYTKAVLNNDQRVLNREYKFTTLINYHVELGLPELGGAAL